MFETMSPLWIPVAVFVGGAISPIVGWAMAYMESKKVQEEVKAMKVESPPEEAAKIAIPPRISLDWMQVLASSIISLLAGFTIYVPYSQAISVGLPDLQLALLAGFTGERTVKKFLGL